MKVQNILHLLNIIGMPILMIFFFFVGVTMIFESGITSMPDSLGEWILFISADITLIIITLIPAFGFPYIISLFSVYPKITSCVGLVCVLFFYFSLITRPEDLSPSPELIERGIVSQESVYSNIWILIWRIIVDVSFSIGCIAGVFNKTPQTKK